MKTKILKPTKSNLLKASIAIKNGDVIAFPTETVYGLGANALNNLAVKKIFLAKNRPSDNPLIVHISNLKQLKLISKNISVKAKILMDNFWPGPLTLILKKKKIVPNIVSAKKDTVGVRIPSNKIALNLIELSNCPIAAPSANSFGKPSPTKAKYVYEDMKNKIPFIIDGGFCNVGIESTIIDMTKKIPLLLRPGKISVEQIQKKIGKIVLHESIINPEKKVKNALAPGMKYKHYSPRAKVYLFMNVDDLENYLTKFRNLENLGIITFSKKIDKIDSFYFNSVTKYSKNIFSSFREFDNSGKKFILVEGINNLGVMNRIKKAAFRIF